MSGDEIEYVDLDEIAERQQLDDEHFSDVPVCKYCNRKMLWVECECCGGDGVLYDAWELDPLWYDLGDEVPCTQCGGHGGWYLCDNTECKGE